MRVEERQQKGTVTVIVGGEIRNIPAMLTIVDTYYDDGRKDCTVKVPRLVAKAACKTGA